MKKFDLNIEKVLEDWEVFHAIREIIANALDETVLSGGRDISIYKDEQGCWHVRDYGRGLRYTHLTQKENEEKLNSAQLIGKFGVGLKDALATFDRRGVKVTVRSPHGDITLGREHKHGFADVVTLHAVLADPADPTMVGTDFIFCGASEQDIQFAKDMFLKFSGDKVLETTAYGQVLEKAGEQGAIYISGVKVAEEENFLFSYNITSLSAAIKKALNRERTNVGRSAYTERVKAILLACHGTEVADAMMKDLGNFQKGLMRDELKWTDVYVHVCKLLNARQKSVFVTPNERGYAAGVLAHARHDGYRIITVPENVRNKLRGQKDYDGNPIRDLNEFIRIWNESFDFQFVEIDELTAQERRVFDQTRAIMRLVGGKPEAVHLIKISETMRIGKPGAAEVVGVWEPDEARIVIKRSQLQTLADFAGTLLHEMVHAITDAPDVSEYFERGLTEFLGLTAVRGLKNEKKAQKPKASGEPRQRRSSTGKRKAS